jgi:ATP-dependent Clp protease adapter protein ClpS
MSQVLLDIGVDTTNKVSLGKPYKVILFNDEIHSIDEVASQIIKAIHCSGEEAMTKTMEVHETGSSVIIVAGLERCEHVESILSEIRLGTKIEPA